MCNKKKKKEKKSQEVVQQQGLDESAENQIGFITTRTVVNQSNEVFTSFTETCYD